MLSSWKSIGVEVICTIDSFGSSVSPLFTNFEKMAADLQKTNVFGVELDVFRESLLKKKALYSWPPCSN